MDAAPRHRGRRTALAVLVAVTLLGACGRADRPESTAATTAGAGSTVNEDRDGGREPGSASEPADTGPASGGTLTTTTDDDDGPDADSLPDGDPDPDGRPPAGSTAGGDDLDATGAPTSAPACQVGPVPASAGLDPFYTQGCRVANFWVISASVVEPGALEAAAALVEAVFVNDPVLGRAVVDSGVRLGIIGADQRTTEMPEYRDLYEVFPDTDWDNRARGLGATAARPLVSAGEENVLCLDADRYRGEDILLHEFAHVLHLQGYAVVDPTFDPALRAAYDQAVASGTWADTYALTNVEEYWAEGVQSYFGRNLGADPADGVHGPLDTRDELAAADPVLHALIDDRLGGVTLPAWCPDRP